jgi:hypothetical protein
MSSFASGVIDHHEDNNRITRDLASRQGNRHNLVSMAQDVIISSCFAVHAVDRLQGLLTTINMISTVIHTWLCWGGGGREIENGGKEKENETGAEPARARRGPEMESTGLRLKPRPQAS